MAVTLVNPTGLPQIDVYRQVSVATGSKLVNVAGQVAWDAGGQTIGEGDLAAQVEQCYLNVGTALAGVGASFSDVVKLTLFVAADPRTGTMDFAGVNEGFRAFFGTAENPETVARSTFEVAGLVGPHFLIEIEAIAAKAPSP